MRVQRRYAVHARTILTWTAAVLAAGLLAGCGSNYSGLQPGAARQLQARVLEVSEASSANDPAAALTALDSLEADLAAAHGKGEVSEERRQNITTIAAAVRADLVNAKTAAEQAAARKAEEERIAAEQAAAQTAPPPPVEPTVAAPAPVPQPAPAPEAGKGGDKRDENEGKGKDDD